MVAVPQGEKANYAVDAMLNLYNGDLQYSLKVIMNFRACANPIICLCVYLPVQSKQTCVARLLYISSNITDGVNEQPANP